MATSSDIVTLNVGGRRFTTTLLTLESSGAAYFQTLLLRWTPTVVIVTRRLLQK